MPVPLFLFGIGAAVRVCLGTPGKGNLQPIEGDGEDDETSNSLSSLPDSGVSGHNYGPVGRWPVSDRTENRSRPCSFWNDTRTGT